jgi:hypothetical protein
MEQQQQHDRRPEGCADDEHIRSERAAHPKKSVVIKTVQEVHPKKSVVIKTVQEDQEPRTVEVVILSDPKRRQEVLQQARVELRAFAQKYDGVEELAGVFEVIDRTIAEGYGR